MRGEARRDYAGLDEAVARCQQAVDAAAGSDRNQALYLSRLGVALRVMFGQSGDEADLARAIGVLREAVVVQDADAGDAGLSQFNLAEALLSQYELADDLTALDAAVDAFCEALELAGPGHGYQGMYESELGRALRMRMRFERTRDQADLDQAVRYASHAVEITPSGHANQGRFRFTLGAALASARSGEAGGSGEVGSGEVGSGGPDGSMTRTGLLGAVASCVERFGPGDLDCVLAPQAVRAAQALTEILRGELEPDLDAWWRVGMFWYCRFVALPKPADETELDRAVDASIEAFLPCFIGGETVPEKLLTVVAEAAAEQVIEMDEHAEKFGDAAEVTRVMALWQRIYDAYPADDADRFAFAFGVGHCLHVRSRRTGSRADLDEGIAAMRDALSGAVPGHPSLAPCLLGLGNALQNRFEVSGDATDLDQGLDW